MRLRSYPDRYDRLHDLEKMDPATEAHDIYRRSAMLDFPKDIRFAFGLTYYRPLAIPSIAQLLVRTGHSLEQPRKRGFDTAVYMFELIENGYDHPRGREVIRALNRMHHRWDITAEDYRYVLSTFVVVPGRWIDQWGWRDLLDVERQAAVNFYTEVGLRMNVKDMPATYAGWTELFDRYEADHLRYSPEAVKLMTASRPLIDEQLPRPLRRWGAPALSALLEADLRAALGLPEPGLAVRHLVRAALRVRALVIRRSRPISASWFHPGSSIRDIYPDGYDLEDLGPPVAHQ